MENKRCLYGNCINSFSTITGERKVTKGQVPYLNTSDFANETIDDNGNNLHHLKISKEEFLKHNDIHKKHEKLLNNPETEFLYNKDRDSYILYDGKKDVHHFYER